MVSYPPSRMAFFMAVVQLTFQPGSVQLYYKRLRTVSYTEMTLHKSEELCNIKSKKK